jgi:hypothetical protein
MSSFSGYVVVTAKKTERRAFTLEVRLRWLSFVPHREMTVRLKGILVCASIVCAAGAAHAVPTTADAGSFTATYDVNNFTASWLYGIFEPIAGGGLNPQQFQVTADTDKLRISFVTGGPNTSLLIVSGGGDEGTAKFNLPLTISADASTQFNVSLGLTYTAGNYTPPPPPLPSSPSMIMGSVVATYTSGSVTLIPVDITVGEQGAPLTSVVLSGAVTGGQSFQSLSGNFTGFGPAHRGNPVGITATIQYIEIDAVPAVPEPSTMLTFAGGLLALWRVRKLQNAVA